MERIKCVICENKLEKLYLIHDVPISLSVTDQKIDTDVFDKQDVRYCENCGCVQLKNLINPEILYTTTHNLTYTHPMWDDHHNNFSRFILTTINNNSIMEIGGSSGALYNKIKNANLEYSCIDLCQANFDVSNIKYVIANCENYKFNNVSCIAMSHVFEHLYDPKKFIENIDQHNIKTVYISIPNMINLLDNKSSSIIHNEHTFFIDDIFIRYLFSRKGYELINSKKFKNHSIFYQFEKTNCKVSELLNREYIKNTMYDIYLNLQDRFTNCIFQENSFIVPAGHMGQLVYNVSKPKSILGFLDNDKAKQGKRQYGTPYNIFPFDELNKYQSEINIYIYAGVYVNELLSQLNIYKNVKIHLF